MQKRVIFALTVATLLLAYTLYNLFAGSDDNEIRQYGKKMVDAYTNKLESRVGTELERLFHDLDENKDGLLTLDEFKDRRLAVAAAMHAARREFNDIIPAIQLPISSRAQFFSFAVTWFQVQFLFLLVFVVWENAQYMLFNPEPRQLNLGNDYLDANPPKMDVATTLTYDTPMTLYERAKMAFFILTGIAFLRLFIMGVCFFSGLLVINIAVIGGRNRKKNPIWFGFWEGVVQVLGNVQLFALGFYCVRVYGNPAPRSEAKLLIGNHTCVIEVVILFLQTHMPSFVSRIENLSIPLFRGLATATNSIIVNRDATASRTQTLDAIKSRAGDPAADQLMLFPEGTCATQRALFMFRKGAFEPGEPVQMVAFAFPYKHFNACWSGRAVGGNDMLDMLLRMACQFVNHCEVRFLPVYYPSEEEKASSELYAAHCQKMLAHVLNTSISDTQFKDFKDAEKRYSQRKHERERWTYIDPESQSPSPTPASASPPAAAASFDSPTSPGSLSASPVTTGTPGATKKQA